ncbi:MAG: hypothetical protein JWP74_2312 [Marmoricola sp.]|nr:hypothetical protein [Marmoricola sp.]
MLLRVLIPRMVAFAAITGALLVGQAMAFSPSAAPLSSDISSVPTWDASDQAAYPGCVDSATWPPGKLADDVVVHRFNDGATEKVAFDDAWHLNHDSSEADDVWVLGVCP